MYRRIDDFVRDWEYEAANTSKIIGSLPDNSLNQSVAPGFRTIGRLAWHIAQTIPEMMNRTGLNVEGVDPHAPVPASSQAIRQAYDDASLSLLTEIQGKWQDATLEHEDNLYGEDWKRGVTLMALMMHQTHHRGQMTVLMRQAGIVVSGIYGPAKEEWAAYGQPEPLV